MSLRCRLGYHDYQGQASLRCQRCDKKLIVLGGTWPKVTQPGDPNRHRLPQPIGRSNVKRFQRAMK